MPRGVRRFNSPKEKAKGYNAFLYEKNAANQGDNFGSYTSLIMRSTLDALHGAWHSHAFFKPSEFQLVVVAALAYGRFALARACDLEEFQALAELQDQRLQERYRRHEQPL